MNARNEVLSPAPVQAPASAPPASPPPRRPDLRRLEESLGDVVMEGELARTPRAALYRVRLERLGDRPVALKVAQQPSDGDELARFRHEARLLSEVRHPNVVEVYDVGVLQGGFPFLVMELVDPYEPTPSPSWDEVYDLAIQAAAGLAHVHHHRVVHLDVKPGNLGLAVDPETGERRLKILDFGLAQELLAPLDRSIRGTLAYTAPEVLLQDRYDHRADLYSLGLTLLEIATGTLPSAGEQWEAILYHLTGEPPDPLRLRPDMPPELAAILSRLLRRDPGERYASAGRLLEELGRAATREIDPGELALGAGGVLASRLVGRGDAMARLSDELASARGGESRVLVVEGPEGIGKSRLLREFRLLASVEGARVVFGRASSEGARALQPFLQALEQLGIAVEPASSGPPPTDARARFRLFREVSRKLAEASRTVEPGGEPLVLFLEDLHLTGHESRELLTFLASDLGGAKVLIVASRRPEQAEGDAEGVELQAPAARTAEPWQASDDEAGPRVLRLQPFSDAATIELVDASLGQEDPGALPEALYTWVHRASGGVPGRVQQLLCHLIDEGDLVFRRGEWKPRRSALARLAESEPDEALAWRRPASFGTAHHELLEAVAIFGEPVRASALADLLEQPPEAVWEGLTSLAGQGLLDRLEEADGPRFTVAGSRLRNAIYASLDPARRTAFHLAAGERLATRFEAGARELASRAAEHLWRGGRRAQSLPLLLAAAREAAAVHGHAEAAALFGRAAEAAEEAGDAHAGFEAREGRARALALAGHAGRALRVYQELLDGREPPAAGKRTRRGRIHLEKGRLHGRLGEHGTALETFEAGLAVLGRPADDRPEDLEVVSELLHGKAVALRDLGRTDEAYETARAALRQASAAGLERQRAFLVNTLAMMFFARGDWRRAGRLARWGLRRAASGEDAYPAVLLRNTLAMVRWKTGDFDAASTLYGENLAAADVLNDPWAQLTALNNLGVLRCGRGDWREARRLLSRSLDMNRRLGAREGEALARINLGEVEEILGDWRRARRHARRALALLEGPGESPEAVAAHLLLGSIARKAGDVATAGGHVQEALAGAEAAGDRDLAIQALFQRGLLRAEELALDRAEEDLEGALARAREAGTGELLGRILLARAELALDRDDRREAARLAAEARGVIEELGDRLSEGRLLTLEARLAGDDGGDDPARPGRLFGEAVACLEAVAAPYELALALYRWGLATPGVEPALERLDRALATFEDLGAEPDAERARGAVERIRANRSRSNTGGSRGANEATLHEVMKIINSSLDQREVLDRTMDVALERLGAERGMIVLSDRLTRELEVAAARNLGESDAAEDRKLSESVVRRVIDSEEPVLAVDALADTRFAGAESIIASHILSILCVPLAIRERLAGAIYVDHCESRHLFSQGDLEFLTAFADGAAVAIDNARLFGELEEARERLKAENDSLRREILASHHLGSIIGKSRAMQELKATLERVAQSSSTVLIRGESGTGKGLIARIIHNISDRREGPFVHFNCAALPETLVESELFGHEKGAFTGAAERKPGRFELAHNGTIFLDEVGKVSRAIQAKLLRVVEDKEFERVGGTRTQRSDARIVAATNLDLEEAIARNEFREDLYYRLNIIPIVLPPLRERREDIPYLAQHFMEQIGRDLGQPRRELDPAVLELFEGHPWPGNVRELESAIHRALVLSSDDVLGPEHFAWIGNGNVDAGGMPAGAVVPGPWPGAVSLEEGGYQAALDALDRRLIETALAQSDGKIREAARILGIARNTLKAKMKRYGIEG
ncbi:MAG: sigma 54-interacting transcriptional regulator [Thermoanaerobaculia bacterium]